MGGVRGAGNFQSPRVTPIFNVAYKKVLRSRNLKVADHISNLVPGGTLGAKLEQNPGKPPKTLKKERTKERNDDV